MSFIFWLNNIEPLKFDCSLDCRVSETHQRVLGKLPTSSEVAPQVMTRTV